MIPERNPQTPAAVSHPHLNLTLRDAAPPSPPPAKTAAVGPDPSASYPEVSLGYGSLTVQLCLVTVQVAQVLLASRDTSQQRTLNPSNLRSLIHDILNGFFRLNGQTIVMDSFKRLIDGQHRLEAVVRTGVPIWAIIVRGVDPQAFTSMDSGHKRSSSDVLKSLGYENTKLLAAACNLVWRYERGLLFTSSTITPASTEDMIDRHPGLVESLKIGMRVKDLCPQPSSAVFCHYVFSTIDSKLANEFFGKLHTGSDLSKGDPILALRERMRLSREEMNIKQSLGCFFKAWNACRKNRRLSKVTFVPATEEFPDLI